MEPVWRTGFARSGPLLLEYKFREAEGKPWLLFLHGYGQDFSAFRPIYEKMHADFSLLAIHLPFHGESQLESGVLKLDDWLLAFHAIIQKEKIPRVHAIAFSMGARFLMTAAIRYPSCFSRIFLLAPDGLVKNFWYNLATGSASGRWLFRIFLKGFFLFRGFIRLLSFLKFIRPGLARFALSELHSPEGRNRLAAVWPGFRLIWPDLSEMQKAGGQITVQVVLGKYDRIIPPLQFELLRKSGVFRNWLVLESGHSGLIAAFAANQLPASEI